MQPNKKMSRSPSAYSESTSVDWQHKIEATVESGKRERSGEYSRSLLPVEIPFLEILKRRKERENRPQDSMFTVL